MPPQQHEETCFFTHMAPHTCRRARARLGACDHGQRGQRGAGAMVGGCALGRGTVQPLPTPTSGAAVVLAPCRRTALAARSAGRIPLRLPPRQPPLAHAAAAAASSVGCRSALRAAGTRACHTDAVRGELSLRIPKRDAAAVLWQGQRHQPCARRVRACRRVSGARHIQVLAAARQSAAQVVDSHLIAKTAVR